MVSSSDKDMKIFFAGLKDKRESLKSPSISSMQNQLEEFCPNMEYFI